PSALPQRRALLLSSRHWNPAAAVSSIPKPGVPWRCQFIGAPTSPPALRSLARPSSRRTRPPRSSQPPSTPVSMPKAASFWSAVVTKPGRRGVREPCASHNQAEKFKCEVHQHDRDSEWPLRHPPPDHVEPAPRRGRGAGPDPAAHGLPAAQTRNMRRKLIMSSRLLTV